MTQRLLSAACAVLLALLAAPAASATSFAAPSDTTGCAYDPTFTLYTDFAALVGPTDVIKGNPDAAVTVIEYFDPNCPHCRTFAPVMDALAARYGERVRFVYKPIVALGQHSILPVAVLHAAARAGKYFEMQQRIMDSQKRGGYSLDEVKRYAAQVGMDPNVLEQELRSNEYSPLLREQRGQFEQLQLRSVPSVLIDGRLVETRTEECLAHLLDVRLGQ